MVRPEDDGRGGDSGKGSVQIAEVIKECTQVLNRYLWNRWKYRLAVKARCSVTVQVGHYKNGLPKFKKMFKCEECGAVVEKIEVNHIEPRISEDGFKSLDEWVARTFVSAEELNGLCKSCHTKETAKQAAQRAKKRREVKHAGAGTSALPKAKGGRKRSST